MIVRNSLVCDSCGVTIIVRAVIGLGATQIHTFACPKCHINIEIV